MTAPSMAEVLAEHWGCAPGRRVDKQYGPICNSSNHTPALYGPTGCEFAADAAQALAAAGFGRVASERFACDMCGHPNHGDTDCGVQVGYDHLNGDHECGCPGSETSLEEARAERDRLRGTLEVVRAEHRRTRAKLIEAEAKLSPEET